MLKRLNIAINF